MLQQNVGLARLAVEAVNNRDIEALLVLMDGEAEAISRLVVMEGGFYGHDGIRQWWSNLFDTWPDLTVQADVRGLADDLTLGEVSLSGRGAGSDIPWEWTVWQVGRWRDGKCVWWMSCDTEAEALEAVGLPER